MENTIPQYLMKIIINGPECFPGREDEIGYNEYEKEIGKGESKVL
jgi:hypothetical protein